ncbi:MAG: RNA polymerase factor sigma-54 [Reyranellaceae bacterium]
MSLAPKLVLGQRQALVMTPQLQQAIKLLQLNQLELAQFVEAELEQNPLLAAEEGDGEAAAPAAEEAAAGGDTAEDGAEAFDPRGEETPAEPAAGDAPDWGAGGRFDGEDFDPLQSLGQALTLREHVLAQIGLEFADPGERLVALDLAGLLDAAGYIDADLQDVAERLGVAADAVAAVLRRLQRFEPAGIFARSLAECLALQLAERDRLDPAMQALLDNLDLVAKRDFAQLMRRCGVDGEDLAQMLGELRQLDPKPGQRFDAPVTQTLVPDLYLRAAPDGSWIIELNNEALPRVLVDRQYHATLLQGARDRAAREFITERLQNASWLVKALDQRANTILRVAREIVRQQEGFFRRGVAGLRPLVLRDIAIAVELHESTISRVTTNKFMATPRGIFELKYFFTSSLPAVNAAGDSVTSEAVRDRIRALIEAEPPDGPLSDDRIVSLLHEEGVAIARRTVAKYRDALGIPSSAQRRREKSLLLLGAGRQEGMAPLRGGGSALSPGEVDPGHS